MNTSCQLNSKQLFIFSAGTSTRKTCKLNKISCQVANAFEAQRVTTGTNFYEILSLDSKNVSYDEIKKAYRNIARQCHPDVVPVSKREECTKRFVELQNAYNTLSNPVLRQKYDFELGYMPRCGATGMRSEGWRADFCKEVWTDQLSGLQRKSRNKISRKSGCI